MGFFFRSPSHPARFAAAGLLGSAMWLAGAAAQFVPVWEIGTADQSNAEFAEEWTVGDDFTVGSPPAGLERSLSRDDPHTEIRFNLTPAQRSATARLRFRVDLTAPGWMDPAGVWLGNGWHDVRISLNGTVIHSTARIAVDHLTLMAEVNAAEVPTLAVGNMLRIERTGGSQVIPSGAPAWSWIGLDYLALEADPAALTDADGDGLPAWWERAWRRSDDVPQATADPDRDALTDAQEFVHGSNPDLADSDGDGLNDAAEVLTAPFSHPRRADSDHDGLTDAVEKSSTPPTDPLLADTDGDGASDGWERHMGTHPGLASSSPAGFSQAVGLDFVQRFRADGAPAPAAVAGVVPQPFWNATCPAAPWAPTMGTMNQVGGPMAGTLVNSAGLPTGITATWSSQQAGFNGSTGSPHGQLLEGFLAATAGHPATVTLTNIPFTSYDVIACIGSWSNQHRGAAQVAGDPATRRFFLTDCTGPFAGWTEATTTQAEMDAAVGGATLPEEISRRKQAACRSGNFVRFRGLTGPSVTVEISQEQWGAGISAVQIVETASDRDGDGMPDSFEFTHGLRPDFNDAAGDADGDGLTHLQEFTRGSNPRQADTDGDGLPDGTESAAHALNVDSDGDGLDDHAETTSIRPTQPGLADSDGDGLTDREELEGLSDPLTSGGAARPVPVYSNPGPTGLPTWLWEVEVQFSIDHGTALLSSGGFGPRTVAAFSVISAGHLPEAAIRMELRTNGRQLLWLLHTSRDGSFSAAGSSGQSGWHEDGPSAPDMLPLLGCSGFGRVDLSDPLRFRLSAVRPGTENSWNLTFEILNLARAPGQQTVISRSFSNTTASAATEAGTNSWIDSSYPPSFPGRFGLFTLPGITPWLGYPPLESLTAFAAWQDRDNDGMPDVWEDRHGFEKNNPADAVSDADSDGLDNRSESLSGTHPRNPDSDGDGVRDGDEIQGGSDPRLASSRPSFFQQAPPAGQDLNGNGLPDPWEMWTGSFLLNPLADDDADGYSNLEESRIGTHALDPGSWLTMDRTAQTPNTLELRWPDILHKRHRLLQSDDASAWIPLAAGPTSSGGLRRVTVPAAAASASLRRFYRPEVTDLDSDGDGLSDWAEARLGTSLLQSDSARTAAAHDNTGDGVPDSVIPGDYAAFAERFAGLPGPGGGPQEMSGVLSRPQAARLLSQGTFGPVMADIEQASTLTAAAWIDGQMALPPTWHSPYIRRIYADFFGRRTDRTYNGSDQDGFLFGNNISTPFFRAAVAGPDQLRQRMAFALSQILVASRRDAALENVPLGLTDFYEIFVRHAFGNYQDILRETALHPVMGRYLSHLGNQKAIPALNQYPDENFAREVMQLFSIGLWELHPDGTRRTTPAGDFIPTYSNRQITEFARVFTGLWFGGQEWLEGGYNDANYAVPMEMHPERHDFGEKTLLGGWVIPARSPTREHALQDIHEALRCLFEHPNTPVFVSRQLIQFLVTSNPTPGYVQRVQAVFTNNGSGVRGDLGAVVKAILLDREARDPRWSMADPDFGKLREPLIRTLHLARLGGLARLTAPVWWNWGGFFDAMKQEVLFSPSVFNFYRPDYQAPGLLSQRNLSGPVFQITDSYSAISVPNQLWDFIQNGMTPIHGITYPLDFSEELPLAATPERLIDRLNLLCCAGRLSAAARTTMVNAVATLPAAEARSRVHLAVYLCLSAPEGAIQR